MIDNIITMRQGTSTLILNFNNVRSMKACKVVLKNNFFVYEPQIDRDCPECEIDMIVPPSGGYGHLCGNCGIVAVADKIYY